MGAELVIDWIMAVADEGYGAGGKRRGRRTGKTGDEVHRVGGECIGPSSRKGRGPQDDKVIDGEAKGSPLARGKKMPPKRVGEMGELAFLQKAMRMGFLVSKPWGDSDRYDFVADWQGKLYRVQVRSTEHRMGPRGYAVHASVYVGRKIVGLTKKDIDVLAAYIFPKDLWYVVPVEEFVPRKNLWFYPDGSKKGSMFEEFREAWGVMRGEKGRKRKRR